MRNLIVFTIACMGMNWGFTQTYLNVSSVDTQMVFTNLAAQCLQTVSGGHTTKIAGVNFIDLNSNNNGFFIFQFSNQEDIETGLKFKANEGQLQLSKILDVGGSDFVLLGTLITDNWGNYPFIATFDGRIKKITSAKIFSIASGNATFELIDGIYHESKYYLLLKTQVEYLGSQKDKLLLVAYNGTSIDWSNIYNTTAPIHNESPLNIAIDPNGNIAVAGTIQTAGDAYARMMLAEVRLDGQAERLKRIELLGPNQTYSNRYGRTFLASRFTNLHLFSQSVIGRSEPGQLLITMFDVDYNLRTWRNYTIPIRAESALVTNEFFYFGGQAPVESGFKAYSMLKINATNAIVEAAKSFEEEVDNFSVATTSASCFDVVNQKVWTFIKDKDVAENDLLIIENEPTFNHACSQNLSTAVAKDSIRIQEIAFSSKTIDFLVSDITLSFYEIQLKRNEACFATFGEESSRDSFNVYYDFSKKSIRILNGNLGSPCLIFNVYGHLICHLSAFDFSNELYCDLQPGVYLFWTRNAKGFPVAKKFIVSH